MLDGRTILIPTRALCLLAVATLAVVSGCSTPEGKSHGRMAQGEVSKSEERSRGPHFPDMQEASDKVAQALMADLNRILAEEVTDPSVRIWLTMGDIDNASRIPTSDYEMIRERIKDKLQKSHDWRNNVKVVGSRQRNKDLNKRELGESQDDVLQEGRPTGPERPEASHFYYLNGNCYGVYRGAAELYYISFHLMRANDTTEVFSQEYEVQYEKKHK